MDGPLSDVIPESLAVEIRPSKPIALGCESDEIPYIEPRRAEEPKAEASKEEPKPEEPNAEAPKAEDFIFERKVGTQ